MGMRKYERKIAHRNMERDGIKHINKRTKDEKGNLIPSYFSRFWRFSVNNNNNKKETV